MRARKNAIRQAIESCRGAEWGPLWKSQIVDYLILCAAQDAGFTDSRWRNQVDAPKFEQWIEQVRIVGGWAEGWDKDFYKYFRFVLLAGRLYPEELSGLLNDLDRVEAITCLVDDERKQKLRAYDTELKMVLDRNNDLLRELKPAHELARFLPDHWWWRYEPSK